MAFAGSSPFPAGGSFRWWTSSRLLPRPHSLLFPENDDRHGCRFYFVYRCCFEGAANMSEAAEIIAPPEINTRPNLVNSARQIGPPHAVEGRPPSGRCGRARAPSDFEHGAPADAGYRRVLLPPCGDFSEKGAPPPRSARTPTLQSNWHQVHL